MASTFVNFAPSTTALFSFQASMNGTLYNVSTPYNFFGQRFYLNVSDLSGNLILARGLVSSGPTFQASFTWENGWATATCGANHNVPIGNSVNLNISQTGTDFDGDYQALAASATTLAYQLSNPEQTNIVNGNVNFSWNLVAGYISGAYLLYHYSTTQFEFGPV